MDRSILSIRRTRCPRALCYALVAVALAGRVPASGADEASGDTASPAAAEFFEKEVRPLLVARCYECHASEEPKGNLRIDSRSAVLAGGDTGPAVVPGKPDESLLVDAIRYGDTYQMPPKSQLPAEEIATLVRWVEMGAPWPSDQAATAADSTGSPKRSASFDFQERVRHWCFQPLAHGEPPAARDAAWPRDPLDRFVRARLEAHGLAPAPPCDRRTLLRRVTYDLVGLPPTAEEIANFLADDGSQAYEAVVERLLASPHYGERQARHWLDLVRYAETYGHEHDYDIPNAFEYRDYCIRAFNADVPYDQFLVEHLAGDLLPQPRRHPREGFNESILGTGFFLFGEARHSPVDVRMDEAIRIDNQIDVLAKAFLALTVSCARCHDHKFDAITQRDYYALAGYLQSSRPQQAFLDEPSTTAAVTAELEQIRGEERDAVVARAAHELVPRAAGLAARLDRQTASTPDGAWQKYLRETAAPDASDPLHAWAVLTATGVPADQFASAREKLVERLRAAPDGGRDDLVEFADFAGRGYDDWFVTGAAFGRRPAAPGDAAPGSGDRSAPIAGIIVSAAAHSSTLAPELRGVLRSQTFTISQPKVFYRLYGNGGQVRLVVDGLQLIQDPIYGGLKFGPGKPVPYWHAQDVSKWIGHRAHIELIDDGDGFLAVERIVFGREPPSDAAPIVAWAERLALAAADSPAALARNYQELFTTAAARFVESGGQAATVTPLDAMLVQWLFSHDFPDDATTGASTGAASADAPPNDQRFAALARRRAEAVARLPQPRQAPALADGSAENERVFIRGNPKALGEEAPRRCLEALGGQPPSDPAQGSGRLDLARSLVEGPPALVPRVIVNRIWKQHFGEGLVRTPDDFGVMGQPPTDPELLDYLADTFVGSGWSIKALHRRIVMSSAYRMSTQPDARALEIDPDNKLLHHVPRRRLEAECIRDATLAVSGRLDRTQFGPGVLPHLTPFMNGRGRPKESGPLDGGGRRSIYIAVRRNFLSPLLLAFDYPVPFTTIGRRGVSNVPAQALVMMNNPFVAEQAALWSARVLAAGDRPREARVADMYLEAYGRPPRDDEQALVGRFLERQREQHGGDAQRAWADLAHVLLNAKEFIFIE